MPSNSTVAFTVARIRVSIDGGDAHKRQSRRITPVTNSTMDRALVDGGRGRNDERPVEMVRTRFEHFAAELGHEFLAQSLRRLVRIVSTSC